MSRTQLIALFLQCLVIAAGASPALAQASAPPSTSPTTASAAAPLAAVPASQRMKDEAAAMRAMMTTDLGKAFLDGAAGLPAITQRTIYREKTSRQWHSEAAMKAALAADASLEFEAMVVDDDRYYDTKYGSPIAYARLFDLIGNTGMRGFEGTRILDIGYGTIGHLRMLATMRANVTGLDVDSFLTAIYSEPGDTGVITNPDGEDGHITLVSGRLNDAQVKAQVGDAGGGGAEGYDLIISKNTLKRGYIHPPAEANVDKRMLIDLGLDDAAFLRVLHDALKPGGVLCIYNICPKQNDYEGGGEKYIPWADGRSPYDKLQFEQAGFRVVILDRDDSEACSAMAKTLGWDKGDENGNGAMDLENDLFAHFTLVEKPIAN